MAKRVNPGAIRLIGSGIIRPAGKSRFMSFVRFSALVSVLLGTVALIISLSVLEGFDKSLRENAVKFTSHIILRSIHSKPVTGAGSIGAMLGTKFPEIESFMPVIEKEGLVRTKRYTEGILLKALYPGTDITGIGKTIKEGTFRWSSLSANETVIGRRLARKLGVRTGDSLVLYAIEKVSRGELPRTRVAKFKVAGIYESGMAQYDDIVVYLPRDAAASLLDLPRGAATNIEIMLKDIKNTERIARDIEAYMGSTFYCLTVFDLHRSVFAWIDLQKEPIPLVLGLISMVAVLNIITALLITVVEKTHTIGLLRTLGMRGRDIVGVFVYQGVSIALAGSLTGAGISLAFSLLQQRFGLVRLSGEIYFLDFLPIEIVPWHYALVVGSSVLLAVAATLLPAMAAVKVSPLKAVSFK